MPWIESHQSLSKHRKTLQLMAILHSDRHRLIGHLHELWWWALDNADIDGRLGHATAEMIADGAGWPVREAGRFVSALTAAEFLEATDGGYLIHDWYDFAGKYMERRAANKQRMQAARAAHVRNGVHARVELPGAELPDRTSNTGPTGPDPPKPPLNQGGPVQRTRRRRREAFEVEVVDIPEGGCPTCAWHDHEHFSPETRCLEHEVKESHAS